MLLLERKKLFLLCLVFSEGVYLIRFHEELKSFRNFKYSVSIFCRSYKHDNLLTCLTLARRMCLTWTRSVWACYVGWLLTRSAMLHAWFFASYNTLRRELYESYTLNSKQISNHLSFNNRFHIYTNWHTQFRLIFIWRAKIKAFNRGW